MSFTLPEIILLLGAAQGFFLAIFIFHKHRELYANRFLALLMLLYGIVFLDLLLWEIGLYFNYTHLFLVFAGAAFLLPPLHFLYAKSLIRRREKFSKMAWLHFLPFLFYKVYLLPDFFISTPILRETLQQSESAGLAKHYFLFNWAITIQTLAYMLLTLAVLKKYASTLKNIFSTTEKIRLDWLRNITYMVTTVMVIFLIENIVLLAGVNLSDFFNISSLLGALCVYVMGYLGISKSEILASPAVAASIRQLSEWRSESRAIEKMPDFEKHKRYEKSGLSQEKAKRYLVALLELMNEKKPYTNSELTLPQLAEMLSISPHNLSEVINSQLEQNFFDFINTYRIEEVKKDLADPQKQHFTILALAFDAGFNSKTSFNTIFKKHTGMTPSDYREQFLRHAG